MRVQHRTAMLAVASWHEAHVSWHKPTCRLWLGGPTGRRTCSSRPAQLTTRGHPRRRRPLLQFAFQFHLNSAASGVSVAIDGLTIKSAPPGINTPDPGSGVRYAYEPRDPTTVCALRPEREQPIPCENAVAHR